MTEGLRNRPGDQPLPRRGGGADTPSVQDELIRLIEQRRELGIRRYGTDLRIFNGRNVVRDALEEALDLASYLTQLEMEIDQMAAKGGTSALVDILGRAGVDTSRDNLVKLSQIVERLQEWSYAQVAARTNWLNRQLADIRDAERSATFELQEVRRQLQERTDERDARQEQAEARVAMLLVAWEPCTPAWLERHGPDACALSARAWVPGGTNHYHPRGVPDGVIDRENAAEQAVHHADRQAAGAGAED